MNAADPADVNTTTRVAALYVGSHHASARWWALGIPLFVSVRTLKKRKRLPVAVAPWALDSGGFTELSTFHRWETTETEYVEQIERLSSIGSLAWVAPQDWMCEPFMLASTGLTCREHQERTVASFMSLRERVGSLVVPVLQGYEPREYDRCVQLYADAGVDLQAEPVVGLGSVCRRSRTLEAVRLVRYLSDYRLNLHGFGLKGGTYRALRYQLVSADSMAWSFDGRYTHKPSPDGKASCANCIHHAIAWRDRLVAA
jgi:hypothetical protein